MGECVVNGTTVLHNNPYKKILLCIYLLTTLTTQSTITDLLLHAPTPYFNSYFNFGRAAC